MYGGNQNTVGQGVLMHYFRSPDIFVSLCFIFEIFWILGFFLSQNPPPPPAVIEGPGLEVRSSQVRTPASSFDSPTFWRTQNALTLKVSSRKFGQIWGFRLNSLVLSHFLSSVQSERPQGGKEVGDLFLIGFLKVESDHPSPRRGGR